MEGGIDLEEAKRIALHVSEIGFAAIEVSCGAWEAITRPENELGWKPFPVPEARLDILQKEQEAYFWENAKEIKKETDTKIILVGGIRSIDKIEEILDEGSVDFCSMARPLIREPDLPNRWLSGEGGARAKCISCNHCLPMEGRSLECRVGEKVDLTAIRQHMFPYFQ
jgi:2,4-dienoyl-CoA reductase-like NADH-dependent reductase (Old Yellow Enzyme family)